MWSRWTEKTVEQVDGAECGQVAGAESGAGGLSRLWNRWIEQTVEQVD